MDNSRIFHYDCDNSYECQPKHIKLFPGSYLIECYGAQGGTGLADSVKTFPGGKGAYTSGILSILSPLSIYLYIGGKGSDSNRPDTIIPGGWNGGGHGKFETNDDDDSGAGGGATDVRLIGGEWNNTESLRSRIMVAAGGSGSAFNTHGAPGGDLNGYIIYECKSLNFVPSTTNQTSGFSFGKGQDGVDYSYLTNNLYYVPFSGGGGGYYGGSNRYPARTATYNYNAVSSSGSSYVSGYPGCKSILKDGSGHSQSPIHYSGYQFSHPVILNGSSLIPGIDTDTFITGNEGNGAIKITLLQRFTIHCRSFSRVTFLFIFIIILGSY